MRIIEELMNRRWILKSQDPQLYYEIKDNVEQAKEWLGKAKKLVKSGSRDEQLIAFYSLELEKRESKLSQLRIQMKRFDDNF